MSDLNIITTAPLAYFYVEKTTSMDQNEIGAAMQDGFQKVYTHMMAQNVTPSGAALAVYLTPPGDAMSYHVGFGISADDIDKTGSGVLSAILPTKRVVQYTHKGPYHLLGATYDRLMAQMAEENFACNGPSWEIYLNDPTTVSEDALLTEIYMPIDEVRSGF